MEVGGAITKWLGYQSFSLTNGIKVFMKGLKHVGLFCLSTFYYVMKKSQDPTLGAESRAYQRAMLADLSLETSS